MKKYYQRASLLINTSYEESFGLVLIEAASYGIPSIAFSCALGAKRNNR
ncbi:MAG: glycosyltransferase family 4 protein [Clostridium sp.]|nr:MAG: glycosyltransferase family 4 protein [Clostridium sp.]